ncbi:hypothetical protein AVEN_178995-1 [Araneus ventricosus]|uniref:Uncharacterized protein n=1 Tax=Araneus ventricosus TaxID=182803 RepID=A0A4Y2H5N8_ARAVE|nr:hypothetical protein AVEN_178995-1 [Araneus ventricosus]
MRKSRGRSHRQLYRVSPEPHKQPNETQPAPDSQDFPELRSNPVSRNRFEEPGNSDKSLRLRKNQSPTSLIEASSIIDPALTAPTAHNVR